MFGELIHTLQKEGIEVLTFWELWRKLPFGERFTHVPRNPLHTPHMLDHIAIRGIDGYEPTLNLITDLKITSDHPRFPQLILSENS